MYVVCCQEDHQNTTQGFPGLLFSRHMCYKGRRRGILRGLPSAMKRLEAASTFKTYLANACYAEITN